MNLKYLSAGVCTIKLFTAVIYGYYECNLQPLVMLQIVTSLILLESSITLSNLLIMLLNNTYNTGVTHDDRHDNDHL